MTVPNITYITSATPTVGPQSINQIHCSVNISIYLEGFQIPTIIHPFKHIGWIPDKAALMDHFYGEI